MNRLKRQILKARENKKIAHAIRWIAAGRGTVTLAACRTFQRVSCSARLQAFLEPLLPRECSRIDVLGADRSSSSAQFRYAVQLRHNALLLPGNAKLSSPEASNGMPTDGNLTRCHMRVAQSKAEANRKWRWLFRPGAGVRIHRRRCTVPERSYSLD